MSESFASMEDRGVPEISAEEEAVLADRLSPQREAEIRELCRGEARMAPRGWMATAQELLAELAAVRKERDEARARVLNEAADKVALALTSDGPSLPGYPLALKSAVRELRRMADEEAAR